MNLVCVYSIWLTVLCGGSCTTCLLGGSVLSLVVYESNCMLFICSSIGVFLSGVVLSLWVGFCSLLVVLDRAVFVGGGHWVVGICAGMSLLCPPWFLLNFGLLVHMGISVGESYCGVWISGCLLEFGICVARVCGSCGRDSPNFSVSWYQGGILLCSVGCWCFR